MEQDPDRRIAGSTSGSGVQIPARAHGAKRFCEAERIEIEIGKKGERSRVRVIPGNRPTCQDGLGSTPNSSGRIGQRKDRGHFAELAAGFVVEANLDLNRGQRGKVIAAGPTQFSRVVNAVDPIVVAMRLARLLVWSDPDWMERGMVTISVTVKINVRAP